MGEFKWSYVSVACPRLCPSSRVLSVLCGTPVEEKLMDFRMVEAQGEREIVIIRFLRYCG
ncbi:unnamed protein product [Moneuplotes crassus]|uniref:Uncharacterized protein n=1 Tax=Euplotes crassus TaxID=5936 RepID=A0AAD2CWA2_EUPCR|nr:unnamed protein product [Moneuplotes crassus]